MSSQEIMIYNLTQYERKILEAIHQGFDTNNKIREKLQYRIHYTTLINSIKKLIFLGLIEKRTGDRQRNIYSMTHKGIGEANNEKRY